jgi:hypothetical protein
MASHRKQQLERLLAMPERQRMPCMVLHGQQVLHRISALARLDVQLLEQLQIPGPGPCATAASPIATAAWSSIHST